jgi:hypothetical protein
VHALRLRGERAPVLAELAGREIAHGARGRRTSPRPFRAVGPLEVEGTPHLVFGGARAKARVRQAGIVRTDRLAGLLDAAEAAGGGAAQPVTVELPVAVDVDAAAAQAVTAELSLSGAQARLAAGDRTGALARLDVAVAADPDDTEMRYWRAIVRMLSTGTRTRSKTSRAPRSSIRGPARCGRSSTRGPAPVRRPRPIWPRSGTSAGSRRACARWRSSRGSSSATPRGPTERCVF